MAIRKVVECDNCKKQHDIPEFEGFMHSGANGWITVIINGSNKRDARNYCSKKCLVENESKNPVEELIKEMGMNENE